MGAMMIVLMTFVITWCNVGLGADFLQRWMKAFGIAYVVGVSVIFFMAPIARKITGRLLGSTRLDTIRHLVPLGSGRRNRKPQQAAQLGEHFRQRLFIYASSAIALGWALGATYPAVAQAHARTLGHVHLAGRLRRYHAPTA